MKFSESRRRKIHETEDNNGNGVTIYSQNENKTDVYTCRPTLIVWRVKKSERKLLDRLEKTVILVRREQAEEHEVWCKIEKKVISRI